MRRLVVVEVVVAAVVVGRWGLRAWAWWCCCVGGRGLRYVYGCM